MKSIPMVAAALCRNLHLVPYLQLAEMFQLIHSIVLSAGGIVGVTCSDLYGMIEAFTVSSAAAVEGGMSVALGAVGVGAGARGIWRTCVKGASLSGG